MKDNKGAKSPIFFDSFFINRLREANQFQITFPKMCLILFFGNGSIRIKNSIALLDFKEVNRENFMSLKLS